MSETPPQTPKFKTEGKVHQLLDKTPWLKMLLYGDPGVGKTILACGAPNPLLVDAEDGELSLLNHPELAANTLILPVSKFNEVNDLFWDLKAGAYPDRETIIIDTFTELQMRGLDEHLDKTKGSQTFKRMHELIASQQDYNLNTQTMRRMFTSFRELERNIIITAHHLEEKVPGQEYSQKRPALTPKVSRTISGLCDIVAFMSYDYAADGKTKTRILQTDGTKGVQAKTRIGGLPLFMRNPDLNEIIEAKRKAVEKLKTEATGK